MHPLFPILALAAILVPGPAPLAGEPLAVEAASPGSFDREVWLEGVVEAVNQATLTARVSGEITEVNFDVNEYVEQGQVLLRIKADQSEAALQQARAGLREARAHLEKTQKEHDRYLELFDKKLVAPAVMDQQRAALTAAKARLESARAQQRAAEEQFGDTVVEAPYSGFVIRRHVELGETANPGQPLFSGVSLDQLRVRVDVPQYLVEQVRAAQRVGVRPAHAAAPPIPGGPVVIFPFADERSHTFRTRVALPDKTAGLRPGMLVKVGFVVGTAERLLVPRSAVVQRGEVTGLYLQDPRGGIRFRSVRTGALRSEDRVEVLAGLEQGERVVLDPVQAGQRLQSAPDGGGRP